MMSEPKPFASLSSTLLARKGHAKPAMRPQGFAGFGFAQATLQEDLGWNDMGHEAAAPQVSADIVPIHADLHTEPETPVVVHQQREELARELAPMPLPVAGDQLALAPAKLVRAAPGSKGKAAFTLRLDPERHLKLRLVCAVEHRSAQQIVVAALDAFLATQASLGQFVSAVPANTKR